MKRILSISAFCFLFSALCFGQFNFSDLAFQPKPVATTGAAWDVTNYPNLLLSWVADSAVTNASGVVTNIPDRGPNGWALTNTSGGNRYFTNAVLNGHAIIGFKGAGLKSQNFTNYGYCEVAAVMRVVAYDTDKQYVALSLASVTTISDAINRESLGGNFYQWGNGGNYAGLRAETNTWMIGVFVHAQTVGGVITNGVRNFTGSTALNTTVFNGIEVGQVVNTVGMLNIAELAVFSGTNTAAVREEIRTNWMSKYGL